MQTGEVTFHNYLTLKSLENFLDDALPNLSQAHRGVVANGIEGIRRIVQKKHDDQFEGYVKIAMEDALSTLEISRERLVAA